MSQNKSMSHVVVLLKCLKHYSHSGSQTRSPNDFIYIFSDQLLELTASLHFQSALCLQLKQGLHDTSFEHHHHRKTNQLNTLQLFATQRKPHVSKFRGLECVRVTDMQTVQAQQITSPNYSSKVYQIPATNSEVRIQDIFVCSNVHCVRLGD